jgi:hypothetical protein
VHEFSGETDARATLAPDDGDAFPPVCVHCGAAETADAPVLLCAVEGEELLLHRHCQADWLDLAIPKSLRRAPKEGT